MIEDAAEVDEAIPVIVNANMAGLGHRQASPDDGQSTQF